MAVLWSVNTDEDLNIETYVILNSLVFINNNNNNSNNNNNNNNNNNIIIIILSICELDKRRGKGYG